MLQFKWIAREVEWVNVKKLVKNPLSMYKGDEEMDTFEIFRGRLNRL